MGKLMANFYSKLFKRPITYAMIILWVALGIVTAYLSSDVSSFRGSKYILWPMNTEFWVRILLAFSTSCAMVYEFSEDNLKNVLSVGVSKRKFFCISYLSTLIYVTALLLLGCVVCDGTLYALCGDALNFLVILVYEIEIWFQHMAVMAVCFFAVLVVKNAYLAVFIGPLLLYLEMFADHLLKEMNVDIYTNSSLIFLPSRAVNKLLEQAYYGKVFSNTSLLCTLNAVLISIVLLVAAYYMFKKADRE